VVNLVTSLGFGVEFCNHIAMNFMKQQGTREERAKRALGEMGSSVLVGITFTKFIGVIVLAFASSTLFKLYYFRMYLFIIILGAFNGLMLLPVLLSLIGPQADINEILQDYKHHKLVSNLITKYEKAKKYDGEMPTPAD
jgi:Niemann-Pick C1 protein